MRNFLSMGYELFSSASVISIDSVPPRNGLPRDSQWDDPTALASFGDPGGHALLGEGINSATGLPMMGVVDASGNPYGTDLYDSTPCDLFDQTSLHHHHWHDTSCSFDSHTHDSFGSMQSSHCDSFGSNDSFGSHDSFGSSFGTSWD